MVPPGPGSFRISSIGGNVATNAGGLCCVKYGVTVDYVLGLDVVLADGTLLRLGGRTLKDVAGLPPTKQFVGSGGTLGVVTRVHLRLVPLPPPASTMVATFPTTRSAGDAVVAIGRHLRPSMLELMDHATINAVEDHRPTGLDRSAGALLVAQSDSSRGARSEDVTLMSKLCSDAGRSGHVTSCSPRLTWSDRGDAIYRMPVPERQGVFRRALLREEVFQRLRAAIVDGTLEPGERLRDAELGRWLGVSRTPIREALARLEQVGLVQTEPSRSTRVSPVDLREVANAQAVCAAMHVLAVREAVPRLSQDELDDMRVANERFGAALRTGDVEAALAADDAFHAIAVQAAGNRAAQAVLAQYGPVLRRVERLRFSSLTGRASVAQHEQVLLACAAGDVEAAAAATHDNWQALEPLLPRITET